MRPSDACASTVKSQHPLLPLLSTLALIFFLIAFWAIHPMVSAQVNASDFTVVVFPDPQNETQYFPQVLNSQTQWIVNNQKALNIQMVLTEGDNINDGASTAQLQTLDAAFRLLDNAAIPYLLGIGNHDYNGFNPKTSRDLSGFNQWFGPGRYSGKAFFGGNFPSGSNANSYAVVTINGKQVLFMTLEFRATSASLDWAESILSANPDKDAIVVAHSFVLKNSYREDQCDDQDMPAGNATGQETWTRLRKHSNVIMVLSGHFTGGSGARRSDLGDNGNLVNQLFADYQDFANGGNGWLRVVTFHPASNTISVSTYSPFLNQNMTDASNQFTLAYHNPLPNSGMGTISGKVRKQSDCSAVAGIKVSAGNASATTASDGTYRLVVPPGSYSVTAAGSGWNTSSKSETVSDSLDTQINFYANPSGCTASAVGVTVCSPASGSTVSSPVRFTAAAKSTLPITAMRIYIDNVSAYLVSAASLDVSLAVASGTHNVVVQAWDSSGVVFKTPLSIRVSAAPTPTPTPTPSPTPTPTPTPGLTGTISGKVINISNSGAVSGATVSTSGSSTTSDSSGNYVLSSLAAGTYIVTVAKTGWLPQSQTATVSPGANTTLNFSISTAGIISGTVKTSSGTGVSGASVTFNGGLLPTTLTVITNSTGAYSSSWIPIGNYTVAVSQSGHTAQTKSAVVNTGATTTLNFTNF